MSPATPVPQARGAALRLQLLGERRLWLGQCDVSGAIRYRKGWALLGYLAVERGRCHRRERIAELLWPTLEPASARTNLRQVLADLNNVLDRHHGGGLLETTRDSIGLVPRAAPQVAIDLLALEAAEALPMQPEEPEIVAVERHAEQLGGEFMAGLVLEDCTEYANWLDAARRRLAMATQESLGRLCRAQQAHARVPQAIACARRLLALEEWHEGHLRQLMTLLAAAGLHQQALDHYQALASSLQAELGTVPEPRTQALRARIEADQRRALSAPESGPSAPCSVAGQIKRWLGELAGSDADADLPAGSDPDDVLPTQRTMPVTGALPDNGTDRGWLAVERGAERGQRIGVSTTPVVVGRSRDSGLCIAHDTVSRQHCAVWRDDNGFRIRDLGSTNGTRVNDAIVQEAALSDGDYIVLGETVLRFGCGGGDGPHGSDTRR